MACDTSGSYKLEMVNDMAVKTGTKQTFVCTADNKTSYTLYDYKFNITGDVTMDYDSSGNLTVTLKNGFIQPAGAGVWPSQKPFIAPWYGDLSSPLPCWRSIAMVASTDPNIPSSGWKKCLGGWYTAGTNCNTSCPKGVNPPGGTYMWWSDTQAGTPWETAQNQHGGRTIPTISWNLGQVQAKDGQDLQVYMYARAERACSWSRPSCDAMPWVASSVPRVVLTAPVCPLEPPKLCSITQVPHICDNCVDVYLNFCPAEIGGRDGVQLQVDYKYADEPGGYSMHLSVGVQDGQSKSVYLGCLIPNREVCWEAKHITTVGESAESDPTDGCFMTEFIPPVWMEVPPITVAECTRLTQGKALEEFKYVTNYWGERL